MAYGCLVHKQQGRVGPAHAIVQNLSVSLSKWNVFFVAGTSPYQKSAARKRLLFKRLCNECVQNESESLLHYVDSSQGARTRTGETVSTLRAVTAPPMLCAGTVQGAHSWTMEKKNCSQDPSIKMKDTKER